MTIPKYTHDCDASLFLGQWIDPKGEVYDLYACKAHSGSDYISIMARFGNEGHEYLSGAIFNSGETECHSLPLQVAMAAYNYGRF